MNAKQANILVVDDDAGVLKTFSFSLKDEFRQVTCIRNPAEIPTAISTSEYDVVLLDMNFRAGINSGNEGIYWLREIRKHSPDTAVIMITAFGNIGLAVRSLKEGATDFMTKPWKTAELLRSIHESLALRKKKKDETEPPAQLPELIHCTPIMKELLAKAQKAAVSDASIMILGESGTGKEVLAKHIHHWSDRQWQPFVSIDPGTIPPTLFESELFGHKAGAFTGALSDRTGRIESAQNGTLFLDEIANLPATLQIKLLSMLQQKEVTPLGSSTPVSVNVRIIAATNENIVQMVDQGNFRQDLFYRLNTITIKLPPLRQRQEDIGLLAGHYLKKFSATYEKHDLRMEDKTLQKLKAYHWPGNIRELSHMIEKAVILSDRSALQPSDFHFREEEQTLISQSLNLEEVEKNTIIRAMQQFPGNLSQVARELGISRKTLYKKIEKYGI